MRATQAILNRPWCITQEGLSTILAIAQRETPGLEAVEAQLGRKLEYTRTVTERGGVATIPVDGPIFRKANLFTAMSGATSLEVLAKDFHAALHNPQVRSILLAIDSPGGEATGINEFADIVYAARGQKPIVAYVEGVGASAAYWIASACDEIICDATAMLGSIGVVAAMDAPDDTGEEIVFVSTQSPNKRPDLRTDDGKLQIQSLIDATADVFIAAVARNRGVTVEHVETRFGAGGLKLGAEAVEAKLADRLGSYEQTLAELQGGTRKARPVTAEAAIAAPVAVATSPIALAAAVAAPLRMPAPPARKQIADALQEVTMSDNPTAPETQPGAIDMELSAAEQAKIDRLVSLREQEWKGREALLLQEAEARFERRMQELQAKQQVESYAQHITTPTLTRQHALPGQASAYSSFLLSLGATQRTAAMGLFDAILATGLVSFEELGSAGEGKGEASPKDQYEAAVNAKVALGMGKLDAIKAVAKEQPALFAAQSEPKKGGR